MTLSLQAFATAHQTRKGPACWLCGIPERAEVEAGRANGLTLRVITRWLSEDREYGDVATLSRVTTHLREHVGRS